VTSTRLLTLDDAPAVAELLRVDREFFAPWDPVRSDEYFTADGQVDVLRTALTQHEQGLTLPHVIVDDDGTVVGRITLNSIVRGPFLSASVGYWVSPSVSGRGVATAALREIKRVAFEELGLHRLEAGTLLHNVRSQRVLGRNGFVQIGLAPSYLKIEGRWQDHLLFQVLNHDLA